MRAAILALAVSACAPDQTITIIASDGSNIIFEGNTLTRVETPSNTAGVLGTVAPLVGKLAGLAIAGPAALAR